MDDRLPPQFTHFFFASRKDTPRRGFVLFLVITVMLLIGIMAFSFSSMKSTTITQLSKTIDQNRLALLAQSANNEALAAFKTEVNRPSSRYFTGCRRDIFDSSQPAPALPLLLYSCVFDDSSPLENSKAMADELPDFEIKLKTKLSVVVTKKVNTLRSPAYIGHLEITSQARDRKQNTVEIKERRDMKFVDLREFFDKYALYVKNYSPDYNEPSRNLQISGLVPAKTNFSAGVYSRVFLGNRFHPSTAEAAFVGGEKNLGLFFDLAFEEADGKKLLGELLGIGAVSPQSFAPLHPAAQSAGLNNAFWVRTPPVDFKSIPCIRDELYPHPTISSIYMKIVGAAQSAAASGDSEAQGKSVAGAILTDYAKAVGTNYSQCQVYQGVLQTFIDNWKYHYGYTDAAHIWDLTDPSRPFRPFANFTHFSGIKNYPDEFGGGTSPYNSDRLLVGRMAKLYGINGDIPVMVEGQAFLRFFKLAYFDEFTTKLKAILPGPLQSGAKPSDIELEFSIQAIAINSASPASNSLTAEFLRKARPVDTSSWAGKSCLSASDGLEEPLMSRAVDLPLNRLILPNKPLRTQLGGGKAPYDPLTGVAPNPEQKGSGGVAAGGETFFPVIDVPAFSYFYKNSAAFLAERVTFEGSEKVLQLDGKLFIEEGDLHLEDVHKYRGQGFIMLGRGNCFLHSLNRIAASSGNGPSTLRIYLQQGGFSIIGNGDATIVASLIALTYIPVGSPLDPRDTRNQGKLLPNGKSVTILGNLIVDCFTINPPNSSVGLPPNGHLNIVHDEEIYDPSVPARISVGPVRTMYSMNAGGVTF
ncbi:MAG: hypothetical protein WA705_11990 [Candidatus Ozemobacteraceae bacterium]